MVPPQAEQKSDFQRTRLANKLRAEAFVPLTLRLLRRGRRDPIDPHKVLSPLDDAEDPVAAQSVCWNAPYGKSLSRDSPVFRINSPVKKSL
jgi:hypothetical protein